MKTNILKAAIFTPLRNGFWGLPLLCWGEPGVAKTAVIEALAGKYSLPCETLSPSERGEGAFGVVPVPSGGGDDYAYLGALSQRIVELVSGKSKLSFEAAQAQAIKEIPRAKMLLTYPAPEWVARFTSLGRGIVFVDEATSTPPALQAPLMGLILARRIGGATLEKGVRVLSAANPVEIAAGGFDIAAPVANRVGHIDWGKPSVEEHVQFMLSGGEHEEDEEQKDAEAEERRVLAAWGNAWAKAVGYETSFLSKRPALKNQCPKAGDPKASRAWPSDRTWEMATRALASADVHGLSQTETEIFVEAFVGAGPAGELFTFMQDQDLPDPADLLDGKVSFKHNPTRIDRTVAVLGACTALVTPKAADKRKDRAAAMWGLLEKMTEGSKADLDIIVPATHALIDADLHAMVEASKPLAKVQPVLRAAGITPQGRRR
jgi:MoxR-like ATPase